ncbi:hypothetical protein GSI_11767 [Ganoderma sinense ZZ0214-1]|uniref:Uncharacterized protein n=1 Tax=Ganoderma sinense ZZ0214-1 TaxID=1077348 RepID=A0A2G8RWX2_9APHY|nr:hypothetical protein GSI_11767 [Ganoderma sinense ZZ0214-1]
MHKSKLAEQRAELLELRGGVVGGDHPSHESPAAFQPPLFLRPQPTLADLLKSSMWVKSGVADPSVETHPHSSWYLWFRSTDPSTNDENSCRLILEPVEPPEWPDNPRRIPFSLPLYVFPLMGKLARSEDERLAREAQRLVDSGMKIKPPPPLADSMPSLGLWEGVDIVTVLQAHNLRHCAITDRDSSAAAAYRQLHTRFSDRTLLRSEGMEYLMKTFSREARYLPQA